MNTSTKLCIALILGLLILVPIAFLAGRWTAPRPTPPAPQVDTVWVKDTANLVDSKPVGSVIATLPIARPAEPENGNDTNLLAQNANLLANCADTLHNSEPVADTKALPDSAQVVIPIEQRTYEGEYYRAVVQGFQPELVSIDIRLPEIVPPEPVFKPGWHFTIGIQLGYGFTPKGWQPYAGIGGTLGWTF